MKIYSITLPHILGLISALVTELVKIDHSDKSKSIITEIKSKMLDFFIILNVYIFKVNLRLNSYLRKKATFYNLPNYKFKVRISHFPFSCDRA